MGAIQWGDAAEGASVQETSQEGVTAICQAWLKAEHHLESSLRVGLAPAVPWGGGPCTPPSSCHFKSPPSQSLPSFLLGGPCTNM